jgi:hypothetical protein
VNTEFGEFEKYVERIGGWGVLVDSMKQFEKDNIFLDNHAEEWRKLHSEEWVAVFKEELIGVAADLDELLKIVEGKNIRQPYSAAISFIFAKKIKFVLACQAAHPNAPLSRFRRRR